MATSSSLAMIRSKKKNKHNNPSLTWNPDLSAGRLNSKAGLSWLCLNTWKTLIRGPTVSRGPSLHSKALEHFVFLASTALIWGATKLKLIKRGTCDFLSKITGNCKVKHPAACWSEAWRKGSNQLSPARAKGLLYGLPLQSSVTTKEDEVVKRKWLRQTDTPTVSWLWFQIDALFWDEGKNATKTNTQLDIHLRS